jgi:hypothetical protein
MPMTDDELMEFLGIKRVGTEGRARIMATITPEKRELYDRVANLETEVALWQDGLGPKPAGVIVCGCGRCRQEGGEGDGHHYDGRQTGLRRARA